MGIAIKNARPIIKPTVMSNSDVSALELIGLLPETKLLSLETTQNVRIIVGSRVEVNHNLFPWLKTSSKGDQGTVLSVSTNPVPCIDKTRYDLFEVELDSVGTEKRLVRLSRWELDLIQPSN